MAASLLDIHLETGRTHQIRVHFSAIKHPCCGDLTYGADPTLAAKLGLERQWLHAKSLAFAHPGTVAGLRSPVSTPRIWPTRSTSCDERAPRHSRTEPQPEIRVSVRRGRIPDVGLFPAFFPLLEPAGALEILAHRMIWTLLLMAVVVAVSRRLRDLVAMGLRNWGLLIGASLLIALNWGVYIYAVNSGHVLDAALGYYINPLVTVLLGVVLFREPLSRWQLLALVLAFTAVAVLTISVGRLPVITLILAASFAGYGAIKKTITVGPRVSLTAEGIVAAPFAGAYLVFVGVSGQQHFLGYTHGHTALMVVSGVVTALPLLLFGAAAQRIPLVTLGLLQYVTPTLQMLWGCWSNTRQCRRSAGWALS